jgi:hypothetical protein
MLRAGLGRPIAMRRKRAAAGLGAMIPVAFLGLILFAARRLPGQENSAGPVSTEEIQALLVDVPGYAASGVMGERDSNGRTVEGSAFRYYKRNGVSYAVHIWDTRAEPEMIKTFRALEDRFASMPEFGYQRPLFEGYPAVVQFESQTRSLTIVLLIADRFLVHLNGIPLDDADGLRALFSHIDTKKLAGLGK